MKSLKNIVYTNLRSLGVTAMVTILVIAVVFQIIAVQNQTRLNADATFIQIEQILRENAAELEAVEAEYVETCLLNGETISYVIQHHPEILGNVEEFRQLAYMMEVDEIHIFDDTGRIFTGTHPEYYNYTFDSGEQMRFFKPMMQDKSLRLCQDITPNTAEGKLVQYSAIWSADEKYIVQVGMYPDAVLEKTEKNELSYIFSLLQGSAGVSIYAIDTETGMIIGSTTDAENGKHMEDIGFSTSHIEGSSDDYHLNINGVDSFAIFEKSGSTLIGYVISNDVLYRGIIPFTLILIFCLALIAFAMGFVVQRFTEKNIIGSLNTTNKKLREVSDGNLDQKIDVKDSMEFAELSYYINCMIDTLLAQTEKIGVVLAKTNMRVGVYEYNKNMKSVRFTDHIPKIFGYDNAQAEKLSSDYKNFETFIDSIRVNPVHNMEDTYRYGDVDVKYLKIDEVKNDKGVLGVVIDVTDNVAKLLEAENDRDYDPLTGLYNRRGLERRMNELFVDFEKMGKGALIVVDLDDMKGINDTYGHTAGDAYLKGQADMLSAFDAPESIAARIGGDEFVLFIYGYENDEQVRDAIAKLCTIQDNQAVEVEAGVSVELHFSFGYQLLRAKRSYEIMFADADEYMYNSKRIRKKLSDDNTASE